MGSGASKPTSSPSPPPATPSPDGAYLAPDRQTRAKCYEARDRFFACLDANGIVDGVKEKEKASQLCGKEDEALARECAASWVLHFKQRRTMEYNKKKQLESLEKEGAEKIGDNLPPINMKTR